MVFSPLPLAGGVRGGQFGHGGQCRPDSDQHTLQILENSIVGKMQYGVAQQLQLSGSKLIIFNLTVMLPSIEFDHQLFHATDEIANVAADRNLSAEFEAIQFATA